jgi:hypothetical protein
VTAPLRWSFDDIAQVQALRDWLVEARVDLQHERKRAADSPVVLRVERVERSLPQAWRPARLPFPRGVRLPVWHWELTFEGALAATLEIEPVEVELTIRDVVRKPAGLRFEGVVGSLLVHGQSLRLNAERTGESEFEAVEIWGASWFRRRIR